MEKQLKIALGSCKRLHKEIGLYEKECAAQEAKIAKLREQPERDEHVIAKQEEVLDESRRMVPDTQKRLALARQNLESLVAQARANADDTAVLTEAFAEAELFLKSN
jgi:tubulin-specific chaperone A